MVGRTFGPIRQRRRADVMRDYDFEHSTGYWICTTSHLYQRRLDKELAPLGITFRQFQVLGWLVYAGPLSQGELAERMMIEPPTLVRILDRMESQGWIVRAASTTDRRRKRLEIGSEAEPLWNRVVDCLNRVRGEATAGLDEQEIETLQNLLQRVQNNLLTDSSQPSFESVETERSKTCPVKESTT